MNGYGARGAEKAAAGACEHLIKNKGCGPPAGELTGTGGIYLPP